MGLRDDGRGQRFLQLYRPGAPRLRPIIPPKGNRSLATGFTVLLRVSGAEIGMLVVETIAKSAGRTLFRESGSSSSAAS